MFHKGFAGRREIRPPGARSRESKSKDNAMIALRPVQEGLGKDRDRNVQRDIRSFGTVRGSKSDRVEVQEREGAWLGKHRRNLEKTRVNRHEVALD